MRASTHVLLFGAMWCALASMAIVTSPVAVEHIAAACIDAVPPSVEITGTALSAEVDDRSLPSAYVVVVQTVDGATVRVVFSGRDPSTSATVEDAWVGDLPVVGHRYRIVGADLNGFGGATTDGTQVDLSECWPSQVVDLGPVNEPAASATSSAPVDTAPQPSQPGTDNAPVIAIAVVLGGVTVMALALYARRRVARAQTQSTTGPDRFDGPSPTDDGST